MPMMMSPYMSQSYADQIRISAPQPYVEQDRVARISAIWEGAAGVVRSIGDVYNQIRYKPEPTRTTSVPFVTFPAGGATDFVKGNLGLIVLAAGVFFLVYLWRK